MKLLEKAMQQQPRTECVDASRNTLRVLIDDRKCGFGKMRVAFPLRAAQAMLDISASLRLVERTEVVGGGHALAKLFEPRAAQNNAKLRLTQEKALQRHGLIDDDIGQHAQFLEGFNRQVLRLIDDQESAPAGAVLGQHEIADA